MSDRNVIEWLYKKCASQHIKILLIMIGDIILSGITVYFSLVCRNVIDSAVEKRTDQLLRSAVSLGIVILLQFLLRFLLNVGEGYVCSRLGEVFRMELIHELLQKDYASVKQYHTGEVMNRMFSDVQVAAEGIAGILPRFLSMISRLICAVVLLAMLEPVFAVIFVFSGLLLIIISGCFRSRMKLFHRKVQEKQGKLQSFCQEMMEDLLIVRIFGSADRMEERGRTFQREFFRAQIKKRTVSICANTGFSLLFQVGYLFAMCWGAGGIFLGTVTYGTLTAILQLIGQVQGPLTNISGLLPKAYGLLGSAERIMELEMLKDEVRLKQGEEIQAMDKIVFSNVTFSYDTAVILKDMSLVIKKGDMLAITGPSGSGKSTMFLLLLGIYRPSQGVIRIEGDKACYQPGDMSRSLFAYVPQANNLFAGTLRENLTFLREDLTDQEIWYALKTACAEEFVKSLPAQLDTMAGEHGSGFSQGQAQRLAVARAVLSGAPVLLLDEATSALDQETEAVLLKNISLLENKTCLIVTHRKEALRYCNKHVVIKENTVRIIKG